MIFTPVGWSEPRGLLHSLPGMGKGIVICTVEDIKRRGPQHTTNFIKETIEVWQPHSSTGLTVEDAHAIIRNMTAFITLLTEWEQALMEGDKPVETIREDQIPIDSH